MSYIRSVWKVNLNTYSVHGALGISVCFGGALLGFHVSVAQVGSCINFEFHSDEDNEAAGLVLFLVGLVPWPVFEENLRGRCYFCILVLGC